MNHREREQNVFDAIGRGDWNAAIEHGTHIPPSHDIWQRMPSAAPMPDEAAQKVLQILTHPYGHHKNSLSSFLFEYANNLPEHASTGWLNDLARIAAKENGTDNYVSNAILSHPNWKADEEHQSLGKAAQFWHSYETKVSPEHFATIKSMFTGKPEQIKDHRGNIGSSDQHVHVLPDLKNHSKKVQEAILKDEFIPKRSFNGKPHIKLYRGLNGHYGKLVRDAANYHPAHQEIERKKFALPTAHLSSWTVDPAMASSFAWNRGHIKDQPNNQGVVLSKWISVDSVLHSGFHDSILGQVHAHPQESEIVVGHPDGKIKISTSDMRFQPYTDSSLLTDPNYGTTVKPAIKKSESFEIYEELAKAPKHRIASAMTALAMVGAPQMADVDPSTVNHTNQPEIQKEHDRSIASIQKPEKIETHPGLNPIRMIESSGGLNTNHPMVQEGPNAGTTAYGQYGLMPMQIVDTANHDRHISGKYPQLLHMDYKKDQNKIFQILKANPDLEKQIANSHWKRLNDRFSGDENRMAYAWLNGITGAVHASEDEVNNHPYVQKYNKFKKMLKLERIPASVNKSETGGDFHGIEKFTPLTDEPQDNRSIKLINDSIKSGNLHNISNVGHFTHDSFIAGFDRNNSWLIKVEPTAKPAIKSARFGLQAVKETAFYYAAKDIFDMGNYTPKAILGEVTRNGEYHPAAAIKMYPGVYVAAAHMEKQKPASMKGILDKYRRNGMLHKMGAMLYILGDADAHGNNVLTNGDHIKLIDHGTSFADASFDPSTDKKIYIPFILRGGFIKEHMSKEEKMRLMPVISDPHVKNEVKHWLMNLDAHELLGILERFHIDPKPTLSRLKLLQKLSANTDNPDEIINQLWVVGFHSGEKNETH